MKITFVKKVTNPDYINSQTWSEPKNIIIIANFYLKLVSMKRNLSKLKQKRASQMANIPLLTFKIKIFAEFSAISIDRFATKDMSAYWFLCVCVNTKRTIIPISIEQPNRKISIPYYTNNKLNSLSHIHPPTPYADQCFPCPTLASNRLTCSADGHPIICRSSSL